jgi:hypothetical protein
MFFKKPNKDDDVVSATMTELILFFLFGCLILLGSQFYFSGVKDAQIANLLKAVATLGGKVNEVGALIPGQSIPGQPQIMILGDEQNKHMMFELGKIEPTIEFKEKYKSEIRPSLIKSIRDFQNSIKSIDVIGHTDEVYLDCSNKIDNTDKKLVEIVNKNIFASENISLETELVFCSNASLGLGRAIAAAQFIFDDIKNHPELATVDWKKINILPYSAGALHSINGAFVDKLETKPISDPPRRRIAIQIRTR